MTPPTPIAYNPQVHGPLDGAYGWNDILLTRRADYDANDRRIMVPDRMDNLYGVDVEGVIETNGATSLEELQQRGWLQAGDLLLQLPNNALVIRRSIFLDACTESAESSHTFMLSADEVRAIAYFSDTDRGNEWCGAFAPGRDYGDLLPANTPWNLNTQEGLGLIRLAVEEMVAAKRDPAHTDEQGRALLAGISEGRIGVILSELDARQSAIGGIMREIQQFLESDELLFKAGLYFAIAMAMVSAIALPFKLLFDYLKNRWWGGGGDGPGSGSGGGGDRLAEVEARLARLEAGGQAAPAEAPAPAAAPAEVQFSALDPETTALVDGYPVSVPPELAGMEYSMADFLAASEAGFVSTDPLATSQAYLQYYQGQGIELPVTGLTSVPGSATALSPGMAPYVVPAPLGNVPLPNVTLPAVRMPVMPMMRAPVVVAP